MSRENGRMIETIKVSLLMLSLTVWSTFAMAQTAPGTPSETPTDAVGDGQTTSWLWVVLAIVVIAGLLYYFLGRGRSRRL